MYITINIMQTAFIAAKPRVALRTTTTSQRRVVVMSTPKSSDVENAIADAKDACDGGDAGEWYVMRASEGVFDGFRRILDSSYLWRTSRRGIRGERGKSGAGG